MAYFKNPGIYSQMPMADWMRLYVTGKGSCEENDLGNRKHIYEMRRISSSTGSALSRASNQGQHTPVFIRAFPGGLVSYTRRSLELTLASIYPNYHIVINFSWWH